MHKSVATNRTRNTTLLAAVAFTLLAVPMTAHAVDLSFKLEPGLAVPLSVPQSQIYDPGFGQSVKVLFGLTPYLDIGPAISFMYLPAEAPQGESGVAWAFGGGLRLKRPHDAVSFYGLSPWLDSDLFYVRTGDLNRAAFDAAAGLAVPIGESRAFWIGPFIRYMQVFQGSRIGYDNRDAKVLILGASFEFGSGLERKREVAAPSEIRTATGEVCTDSDRDGIPDNIDHCPEVAGPMDNWGCPNYKKLVVKQDKLELKEKLYFGWNQANLEAESYPVLDEVVQALNDNKGFTVQIEGHTDSSGADDHNMTLSEERAATVLNYLVSHGIAKSRLISKGFSSLVPLDTNATVAGRENNRRVEFVVHFVIVKTGSAK